MAHPASRVPSFSKAWRTPLAMRDCSLLKTVVSRPIADRRRDRDEERRFKLRNHESELRPDRLAIAIERHDNGHTSHRDAGAQGDGLTVGFSPSLPQPGALRHHGQQLLLGRITGAVIDIEDLEGMTCSAAAISETSGATLPASFFTGTITDITGAELGRGLSAIFGSMQKVQRRARVNSGLRPSPCCINS